MVATPLTAVISGGTSKTVAYSSPIELDASGSRDPDVSATADQGLTYTWTCRQPASADPTCRSITDLTPVVLGSTAAITVPAFTLAASANPYEFTVTVSKGTRSPVTFTLPVTVRAA